MQFTLPTTKAQMYEVLGQIYNYYRITREGYTDATLKPLELDDMEFTELTPAQLKSKAATLVKASHEREMLTLKKTVKEKIAALTAKKETVAQNAETLKAQINATYAASEDKTEKQAVKSGFARSNVIIDKIAELEAKKNAALAAAEADKNAQIAEIEAEITAQNAALAAADEYYDEVHASETEAKAEELKAEQDETVREVFKYNNSLSEKRQKYDNYITVTTRSLRLRYMDIRSSSFTKEQLVEMGYYADVIDCVCAYYDLLSEQEAFQDITSETKLITYLDDYYQNILYMYKMRIQ